MPELPDIEAYLVALRPRLVGNQIVGVRIAGISVLKSLDPPVDAVAGRVVTAVSRLGKRIVVGLDDQPTGSGQSPDDPAGPGADELFLIVHLMIAGRLRWREPGAAIPKRLGLAAFDIANRDGGPAGTLILTEAGTKKRASLYVVRGAAALHEHDRGGIEPLTASRDELATALTRQRRTVKRALADPRVLSGIGNAYSDEILHRARLSPIRRTDRLDADELDRLHTAMVDVLTEWTDRLAREAVAVFPQEVTAFRPDFAVHGCYGQPCPVCGTPVARIRYADNETNYCPRCQTGGRLLADRSLSRLLKDDWPREVDDITTGPGADDD